MRACWRFAALGLSLFLSLVLSQGVSSFAEERIVLATDPALSPDGQTLIFTYRDGVWSAPVAGGIARPLTTDENSESDAQYSPDGKTIAFISNRTGSRQVYTMPATGGTPKQITFHTSGFVLNGWSPAGDQLLVSGSRDHFWRRPDRMFWIPTEGRKAEVPLFDDYGSDPSVSPDGKKVLFTREGEAWWRKGYKGSQASQIWLFNTESKEFTRLLDPPGGARWPLWKPDGKGFFYCNGDSGILNLHEYDLESKADKALTDYKDEAVVFPTLSRDGKTLVFRRLFDFYRYTPGGGMPEKIDIVCAPDLELSPTLRRQFTTASDLSPNKDGLELAFIAGGDVWVMDTELREPRQVTNTPEEERDVVFSPAGDAIWFVSDAGGQTDVWKAEKSETDKFWWLNSKFNLKKVTEDGAVESSIKFSPEGSKVAFNKDNDLWVAEASGKDLKKFLTLRDAPSYDWSPDGKWVCYATGDDDYNSDIWIAPLDGSKPPYNLSRHPDNDMSPVWSPDGKMIAFTGRQVDREVDVYVVYLTAKAYEEGSRDRKLQAAMEKMTNKGRGRGGAPGGTPGASGAPGTPPGTTPGGAPGGPGGPGGGFRRRGGGGGTGPDGEILNDFGVETDQEPPKQEPPKQEPPKQEPPKQEPAPQEPPKQEPPKTDEKKPEEKPADKPAAATPPAVVIDFDNIHKRIRRISNPDSAEGGLIWAPDSKKLAFSASVGGVRGIYSIEFPDNLRPTLLTATGGSSAKWLSEGNQIIWLVAGVPTSTSPGGRTAAYSFTAAQEQSRGERFRAAFDQCWRTMRDRFYDARLGNKNWDEIRRKYSDAAAASVEEGQLATIVSLMLGELNGSHLGFTPSRAGGGGPPGRRGGDYEVNAERWIQDLTIDPLTLWEKDRPTFGEPDPEPEPPPAPRGPTEWRPATAHLGLRFDPEHKGPGLKVRDVIFPGPTSQQVSLVKPGELVLTIDGVTVDPAYDLTQILNGLSERDVKLTVRDEKGADRTVTLRPTTYPAIQAMMYNKWIDETRKKVDELSGGTLGYLHIQAMSDPSFIEFDKDLYFAGAGKEGLIIDVRENGGGSTADHVLTALTQPVHAITLGRAGGPGYPQDRKIYATWNKPIVMMCNQNSFSNAEIISHAVKTLKRGKVVGVPTAGGVISTGAARIMDIGQIRTPGRGWYLLDGQDMELNGCVPDVVIWPEPGQMPKGEDVQLGKAVETLMADVKEWKARPQPKLIKASERGK